MSSGNFYGSSASNRGAPPPPPKPASNANKPAAARNTATRMSSRPKSSAYVSNRSVVAPSSRSSGISITNKNNNKNNNNTNPSLVPKAAMPGGRNRPSSSAARDASGTTKNRPSLSAARKAPVASRPVGSYYNSASAASSSSESTNTSNGVAGGALNPYASSATVAASAPGTTDTTTNDEDTWDDWGSPPAKATTVAPTTTNPHSSWAAPVSNAPAASTNTNNWYSSGGSATNNNNPPAAASSGYTSSGFGNQPSQQQQQQQQHQQNQVQPGSGFYQNNIGQQQPFLSGAMDSSAPTMSAMNPGSNAAVGNSAPSAMPSFSMFMPSATMQQQQPQGATDSYSIEDEAPLLEELGINIQHMMLKTKAVVFPFSRFGGEQMDPSVVCQDGDLPGPVALLLLLGGEMVLSGKLQFGYIYIYGLVGCIAMTFVVNLISPKDAVSFWTVTSIMGYALLPVNILALFKIFVINLINSQLLGNILGGLTVLWSTMASTRLLELGCDLRDQRYLIMYPLLLFYSAFVMMTIL